MRPGCRRCQSPRALRSRRLGPAGSRAGCRQELQCAAIVGINSSRQHQAKPEPSDRARAIASDAPIRASAYSRPGRCDRFTTVTRPAEVQPSPYPNTTLAGAGHQSGDRLSPSVPWPEPISLCLDLADRPAMHDASVCPVSPAVPGATHDLPAPVRCAYAAPLVADLGWYRSAVAKPQGPAESRRPGKGASAGLLEPVSLHPVIDARKCIGCGSCVKACPEQPEHQVLGLIGARPSSSVRPTASATAPAAPPARSTRSRSCSAPRSAASTSRMSARISRRTCPASSSPANSAAWA